MSTSASHPREEEAITFSFGLMDEPELLAFAEAMKSDPALRDLVHELQEAAAAITFDAPQELAPPDVRSAVLTSIQTMPQLRNTPPARRIGTSGFIGWAAAAALAVTSAYSLNMAKQQRASLATTQAKVRQLEEAAAASLAASQAKVQQLEQAAVASSALEQSLKLELARLTRSHEMAKVQIANLKSTVAEYQQGVAVVVWNSEKQEGILKLEKMPPVAES